MEQKKLNDYLHLYMWQMVKVKYENICGHEDIHRLTPSKIADLMYAGIENCRLILRRFNSISEKEIDELLRTSECEVDDPVVRKEGWGMILGNDVPLVWVPLLLRWGIDIFGLIDAGIAIDKKLVHELPIF